ncbi:MAG: exodeoxyribonuclease VII large subunit, partial [bacterium]
VGEITRYIKRLVEGDEALQDIWVRGEVSNFKAPSRHLYFALKDEEALLSCIMFQDRADTLKFTLKNGLEVVARGSMGVYKPQGKYQLYVQEILPLGEGVLYLRFEQLKEELKRRGYFEPEHKVPLPYLPQKIGVATSPEGAAIRDILTVLDGRFPNVEIVLSPCRVQGEEAPEEIAQAIRDLNDYGKVDVIIVGRGGGSFEDLFSFNERIVAEAIYDSRIPIVSAVGHEIDATISDFVADERAPTPSAAAELIIPKKKDLLELLKRHQQRTSHYISSYLNAAHADLDKIKNSLVFRQPYRRIEDLRQGIDDFERRMGSRLVQKQELARNRLLSLAHGLRQSSPWKRIKLSQEELNRLREKLESLGKMRIEKEKEKLSSWKNRLRDLSPLSILKRGYSICFNYPKGEIITAYKQVKKGGRVRIKLHRGALYSRVYQREDESEV